MRANRCAQHPPRRRHRSPRRWRLEGDLQLTEAYRAVVPFGMYRGWLLCRTPVEFLAWLANARGVDAKLKRLAAELLAMKGVEEKRATWGLSEERAVPGVQA
jgi:uncharacterized protein (DUF3820 family)